MQFSPTAQFVEAMQAHGARAILPTGLRTRMLQQLPAQVRQQAFFSAGVTVADWLEEWYQLVTDLMDGSADRATARLAIKEQLARAGYVPAEGTAGGLLDLSSDKRLNLILDTQWEINHGRGQYEQSNQPEIVEAFPARELYRAIITQQQRDWIRKWQNAGGKFYGGRMIARVDDPIWTKSLDAGGFNRFGIPTGPFDFNSGMRTRPVSFDDAERLGVIKAGEALPQPQELGARSKELGVSRGNMSPAMREAIEQANVGQFDADGVLQPLPPF